MGVTPKEAGRRFLAEGMKGGKNKKLVMAGVMAEGKRGRWHLAIRW